MAKLLADMDDYRLTHFIDEPITVMFSTEPLIQKSPPCPESFRWNGEEFIIIKLISNWQNFSRRGRMARNMSPGHAFTASRRGSWGVGRFYFRILTQSMRIFDLYYNHAPQNSMDRKGSWFLLAELKRLHE